MEVSVKTCPFCGCKSLCLKPVRHNYFALKCNGCGAGILGKNEETAIQKWNSRKKTAHAGVFTIEENEASNGQD